MRTRLRATASFVVFGMSFVVACSDGGSRKGTGEEPDDDNGGPTAAKKDAGAARPGKDASVSMPEPVVSKGPARDAANLDLPSPPATSPAPSPPWTVEAIGKVTMAGEARYSRDRFRLFAAGEDVAGKEDAFLFAYRKWTGDGEIVAKVASVDYTHPMAKGGLMIRASSDPGAANVFLCITGGGSGLLQHRATAGADTMVNDSDKYNTKAGIWLKLVRTGNVFKAYRSEDRGGDATWTLAGMAEVAMPAEVLVGLGATSHDQANPGLSEYEQIRISNFGGPTLAGWYHEDLGIVSGLAKADKGALVLESIGDVWSSTQEFGTFAFRMVDGDFTLTARVVSLDKTNDAARVGLMARNADLKTWSRSHAHAALTVTPEMGGRFQHKPTNGGNLAAGEMKPELKAPVWLRLERKGLVFTGFSSPDGKDGNWQMTGQATFEMGGIGSNITVGFISTSGTQKAGGTAVLDNIKLQSTKETVIIQGPAPPDAGAPDGRPVDARPVDARPVDARRG